MCILGYVYLLRLLFISSEEASRCNLESYYYSYLSTNKCFRKFLKRHLLEHFDLPGENIYILRKAIRIFFMFPKQFIFPEVTNLLPPQENFWLGHLISTGDLWISNRTHTSSSRISLKSLLFRTLS